MPKGIIEFASTMVVDDEHKVEDMLKELNTSKIKYQELLKEITIKSKDLNQTIKEYDSRMNTIKQTEKEIINEAKSLASNIVDEGRGIIEKAVKEIKEKEKSISEIKKDFAEKSQETNTREK